MLSLLNRWRAVVSRGTPNTDLDGTESIAQFYDNNDALSLPWPVTEKGRGPRQDLNHRTLINGGLQAANRTSPPHVAWLSGGSSTSLPNPILDSSRLPLSMMAPPSVVRIDSSSTTTTITPQTAAGVHESAASGGQYYATPIERSVSSPASTTHMGSAHNFDDDDFINSGQGQGGRWGGLRLHTGVAQAQSYLNPYQNTNASSFPTLVSNVYHNSNTYTNSYPNYSDSDSYTFPTDVYGGAYAYPLVKQLSPIAEQDYFSPTSVRGGGFLGGKRSGSEIGVGSGSSRAGSVRARGSDLGRDGSGSKKEKRDRESKNERKGSGDDPEAPTPSAVYSTATSQMNPSPGGSCSSEITRPSPIYASPFITRQLNRTVSQTSSRTHVSTATASSAIPPVSRISCPAVTPNSNTGNSKTSPLSAPPPAALPTAPPHERDTPVQHPLRPRRSTVVAMPTISSGSDLDRYANDNDEGYVDEAELYQAKEDQDEGEGEYDRESLHADSFVTATSEASGHGGVLGGSVRSVQRELVEEGGEERRSAGESFIMKRWDRSFFSFAGARTGSPSRSPFASRRHPTSDSAGTSPRPFNLRFKKQRLNMTPAWWAFWLGFICPVLWLVGGWHFTNFGEQPPRLTFWEFYFNAGYWKEWAGRWYGLCTCFGWRGRRRSKDHPGSRAGKGRGGPCANGSWGSAGREEEVGESARKGRVYPPLPRWVAEKQSSDDGRARLNDPKRSLRGISFGYPFIPRSVRRASTSIPNANPGGLRRVTGRVMNLLDKPNRVLDQLYGVKLREVRGRPESGRRMFDPWIQRCRYALCWAIVVAAAGLCCASVWLIVVNTRTMSG